MIKVIDKTNITFLEFSLPFINKINPIIEIVIVPRNKYGRSTVVAFTKIDCRSINLTVKLSEKIEFVKDEKKVQRVVKSAKKSFGRTVKDVKKTVK